MNTDRDPIILEPGIWAIVDPTRVIVQLGDEARGTWAARGHRWADYPDTTDGTPAECIVAQAIANRIELDGPGALPVYATRDGSVERPALGTVSAPTGTVTALDLPLLLANGVGSRAVLCADVYSYAKVLIEGGTAELALSAGQDAIWLHLAGAAVAVPAHRRR